MTGRDRSRDGRGNAERAGVRLQRVLAEAGIAARRVCESMIEQGRVAVNGRVVRGLPAFVDPARDTITVDGRPLPPRARPIYVMVHKPERVLGSTADEPGADRHSVADLVRHPRAPRLFPVGRLDYEARGLVLLTNDGDLAYRLTHPRFGVPRTYEVVVRGQFGAEEQARVEREMARQSRRAARRGPDPGTTARRTGPTGGSLPLPSRREGHGRATIEVVRREPTRTTLRITLAEGRNRQLPEILRAAGCAPRRITRIAIGPLELRGLPVGGWRELTRAELRALREAARAASATGAERGRPEKGRSKPERGAGVGDAPAEGSEGGRGEEVREPAAVRSDGSFAGGASLIIRRRRADPGRAEAD